MIQKRILILLLIGLSNGQHGRESSCFSQQEFEIAYENALIKYRDIENKLLESINSGEFGIPRNSPIYHHFASSHISPEILAHDEFANVCNIALKVLLQNYTLTEFKKCLPSVVTSKYCTPLPTNCKVDETRLVTIILQKTIISFKCLH